MTSFRDEDFTGFHPDEHTRAKEAHVKEALRAARAETRVKAGCCPTGDRSMFPVPQACPLMDINSSMSPEEIEDAGSYNEKASKANADRDVTLALNVATQKYNQKRASKRSQVDREFAFGNPCHTGESNQPKEYHIIVGSSLEIAFRAAQEFAAFKKRQATNRAALVADMAKSLRACDEIQDFQRLTLEFLTAYPRDVVLEGIAVAMSDPLPSPPSAPSPRKGVEAADASVSSEDAPKGEAKAE